ncbi:hypothetical protein [Flexivirga sp.]|uniref:hypothetical protein n=1 Tax=Flexivirga sp. TaxID=1962927 RepID=UPI003F80B32A
MDLNLQAAVDMTITRMLDGTGLHGVPGPADYVLNVADGRESAQIVCTLHGVVLADLDDAFTITTEYECTECEFYSCTNCDQAHQRPCAAHRVEADEAFEVAL